jgi:hypothetical protein
VSRPGTSITWSRRCPRSLALRELGVPSAVDGVVAVDNHVTWANDDVAGTTAGLR